MKCIERLQKYKTESLDSILLDIKKGNIKSGKYSHLVKIDKDQKIKEGKLFKDEKESDSE
jgi:hypothetical protein